ncbi:hypothetical protein U9K52_09895 [Chryseobacterium sp. MHB01]|uniref:hypothetical protein n=1 Tax=Chryseobacterium sp. MHB01 TaxID=3109433 RepID=UPI002AFEC366|nr:hypothetical protein [Chryseobacterium sp. MHB01]MEA1849224.1 hypothetical protein [Chryseobacterium sp. MHB01]
MSKIDEILKKHCPSMDNLFLDKQGREFRDRVLEAMKEYAIEVAKATLEKASALMYEYNKDSNPQEASDLIENPDNITLL